MAKIRIFQIAKELNLSHTDILSFLKGTLLIFPDTSSTVPRHIPESTLKAFIDIFELDIIFLNKEDINNSSFKFVLISFSACSMKNLFDSNI